MRIEQERVIDIHPTTGPATSSTSDIPVVTTKPDSQAAPTDETAPKPAPKTPVEEQGTEDTPPPPPKDEEGEQGSSDEGDDDVTADPQAAKPAKGVKVALDRLTKQREEARERADSYARQLEAANAELARLRQAEAEAPAPQPPRREDYTDPDDYIEALSEFKADQKVREQRQQDAERAQADAVANQAKETQRLFRERATEARKEYADFDEVTSREDVPVTIPMAHAILTSEIGPKLQYYLGRNTDEAKRIAALDPISQVREMGRLEAKVLGAPAAPVRRVSETPPPIKPVGGSRAAVTKDPGEMSMEEYAAHRGDAYTRGRRT